MLENSCCVWYSWSQFIATYVPWIPNRLALLNINYAETFTYTYIFCWHKGLCIPAPILCLNYADIRN